MRRCISEYCGVRVGSLTTHGGHGALPMCSWAGTHSRHAHHPHHQRRSTRNIPIDNVQEQSCCHPNYWVLVCKDHATGIQNEYVHPRDQHGIASEERESVVAHYVPTRKCQRVRLVTRTSSEREKTIPACYGGGFAEIGILLLCGAGRARPFQGCLGTHTPHTST